MQSTTACCTDCTCDVSAGTRGPTFGHPSRQHARCHNAGDSVSPTVCGGYLPQDQVGPSTGLGGGQAVRMRGGYV